MAYVYPETKWFIGRLELKRIMASTMETFKKVCKHHKIPPSDWKLNQLYNFIEFKNGSKIDLLDVKTQPGDPLFERFGSTEYTGGWGEETGEWPFGAFDVLKTRIGRHMNKEYDLYSKFLLTANPKKNWMKRLIWRPFQEGTLDKKYTFVQSLYSDNRYTAAEYGENLDEIADKVTRQRLRDGSWNYDDDESCLITADAIQDIWTNSLEYSEELYATLDVARFGKDKTVMYLWRGWNIYKIIVWEKLDTNRIAEKVKIIMRDEKIPRSHLIIDEVGVGGGVLDQLRGARGFIANASPMEDPKAAPVEVFKNGELVKLTPKENFNSLKDQCGFRLSELIENHKVGAESEDEVIKEHIEEELGELKDLKPDEETKKQLVSKKDIKENIGRSPDHLDNFLMRYAFELNPPREDTSYADEAQVRTNRQARQQDSCEP